MREFRVGVLQFGAVRDKGSNLEKIAKMLRGCSTDLVVLPEYSMGSITGLTPEGLRRYAEPLDGPFVKGLGELAREYGTYLIAGVFELVEEGVYNTAVVLGPDGGLVGTYRKIHLFDAYGYRESDYFLPGGEAPPVIDMGRARVGLVICFDIRFPELFRSLALRGAEVIAVPMAWFRGPLKEETLRFLARARAHENTVYLVLAVQYSSEFTGRSMIIDPSGVVIADLGVGEKYVELSIDLDYIAEVRKYLPLLNLRRPDVYG